MVGEAFLGSRYGGELSLGEVFDLEVARSSLSRAREKLTPQVFEELLEKITAPNREKKFWFGHAVHAVDGSYLTVPASADVKASYPVRSHGKEHYPKALCVVAYSVFACQPTAMRIGAYNTSEHEKLLSLLDQFKAGDVTLLDRYFHSRNIFGEFFKRRQHFIVRAKLLKGDNAIATQLKRSGRNEIVIKMKIDGQVRRLRLIKTGRKTRPIVLITDLISKKDYPRKQIAELYKERWQVETMFKRLKQNLGLQNWHTKTAKGVHQEVLAHLIALAIAAGQMRKTTVLLKMRKQQVGINFTGVIAVFWKALIKPITLKTLRLRLLKHVVRRQPNRSYPRHSKQPMNRWIVRRWPTTQRYMCKETRKAGYGAYAR